MSGRFEATGRPPHAFFQLAQKSIQRPFFSQSPKRVGSGPVGPPISRCWSDSVVAGAVAQADRSLAALRRAAVGSVSRSAAGRTECGGFAFCSAQFGIP